MRRLYLAFGMFCLLLALIAALYGYYLIVRSPGVELSIMEFVERLVMKIARFIIK